MRLLLGRFTRKELMRYLAVEAIVFWGLILLCLKLIPTENVFGIASHPFSYLGGFDPENNPEWWWVFSVAMGFWALSSIPVILYIRHRFAQISQRAAWGGAGLLLLGSFGIFLVGVIPTGHAQLWGAMSYIGAHRLSSLPIMIGFGFGSFWHEVMLFVDGFSSKRLRGDGYRKFVALYAIWWGIIFAGVYFLIRWVFVYERLKSEAAASGRAISGSWTEALNTVYSIPLWENILIVALFTFMTALPMMLPDKVAATE